jgi:hypothetical protein
LFLFDQAKRKRKGFPKPWFMKKVFEKPVAQRTQRSHKGHKYFYAKPKHTKAFASEGSEAK